MKMEDGVNQVTHCRKGNTRQVHSPQTKDRRPNDRHDPMHPRIRAKPEHEQTTRNERGAHNDGRQLVLGLALHDARLLESLLGQAISNARPDGSDEAGQDHGHAEAHEGESDLPEIEAIVGAENEGKCAKEEIQNAQEYRRVDVQDETHGLKQEKLKRS